MDRHTLSNGRLGAAIKADGAELCSLTLDGDRKSACRERVCA